MEKVKINSFTDICGFRFEVGVSKYQGAKMGFLHREWVWLFCSAGGYTVEYVRLYPNGSEICETSL